MNDVMNMFESLEMKFHQLSGENQDLTKDLKATKGEVGKLQKTVEELTAELKETNSILESLVKHTTTNSDNNQ